jgi:hypothetical protein
VIGKIQISRLLVTSEPQFTRILQATPRSEGRPATCSTTVAEIFQIWGWFLGRESGSICTRGETLQPRPRPSEGGSLKIQLRSRNRSPNWIFRTLDPGMFVVCKGSYTTQVIYAYSSLITETNILSPIPRTKGDSSTLQICRGALAPQKLDQNARTRSYCLSCGRLSCCLYQTTTVGGNYALNLSVLHHSGRSCFWLPRREISNRKVRGRCYSYSSGVGERQEPPDGR